MYCEYCKKQISEDDDVYGCDCEREDVRDEM